MMAMETDRSPLKYKPPTPTDTPFRTPSSALSRRSSRQHSVSPAPSSSPPPISADSYGHGGPDRDVSKDEKISILDPRRFTPNLHASLVAEILSLRREVDSKNGLVADLEEGLQTAQDEADKLKGVVATNATEKRLLARQLEDLEGGTLAALEEMARERDAAVETLADIKRRLDGAQTKVRSQEEAATRSQAMWDGDRQRWDNERRNLDRKVHVVEGRLKMLLAELEAVHASQHHLDHGPNGQAIDPLDPRRSESRQSVEPRRCDSRASNGTYDGDARSVRFSHLHSTRGATLNGISLAEELAEELAGDAEDDGASDAEDRGPASPDALPEETMHLPRSHSAQSQYSSSKARKLLGLNTDEEGPVSTESVLTAAAHDIHRPANNHPPPSTAAAYTDAATQFTPPPSPPLDPQHTCARPDDDRGDATFGILHATDSRTDPAVVLDAAALPASTARSAPAPAPMVSHACQTMEHPLSPPDTPKHASRVLDGPVSTGNDRPTVQTMSTQLDDDDDLPPRPSAATAARDRNVPTIAIHPPVTAAQSGRGSVVLPPRTKSVGCQASVALGLLSVRSTAVQTEEIRIDQRPVKLPPHLLPSAVSSQPPSPTPPAKKMAPPERSHRRPTARSRDSLSSKGHSSQTAMKARAKNGVRPQEVKLPVRRSSLFAGFDDAPEVATPDHNDADQSDDSLLVREPIRKTLSKIKNAWKVIPQEHESRSGRSRPPDRAAPRPFRDSSDEINPRVYEASREQAEAKIAQERRLGRGKGVATKPPNIRKAALISSGSAAHSHRTRSPGRSDGVDHPPLPPFPVPTRASSRRLPISISEGARSPTPQATAFFGDRPRHESSRPLAKKPALRKIRSAAAAPTYAPGATNHRHGPRRSRSPPPPTTAESSIPASPQLPPPLPPTRYPVPHPASPSVAESSSTVQPTSVVDAIAQTMIGEWMWKYVRKRRSFGLPETAAAEFENGRSAGEAGTGSGVRHKRWVWLAPYERAVMWSTKQPTSGSALMGKNGRKLAIQSVLDVKDETPMPKNGTPPVGFGRSILILTPQRALKFTATTRERHYVWLTALSFLSHSSGGVSGDLPTIPLAAPTLEYEPPPSPRAGGGLRRHPIRDSIRVAKDKARPELAPSASGDVGGRHHPYPYEDGVEAAEPPLVPRFSNHLRKRSNTGPRPVPASSSVRSFSSHHVPVAASEGHGHGHGFGLGSSSSFGVEEGALAETEMESNFFDAVGTIRMEAFVDRTVGMVHGYGRGRGEGFHLVDGQRDLGTGTGTGVIGGGGGGEQLTHRHRQHQHGVGSGWSAVDGGGVGVGGKGRSGGFWTGMRSWGGGGGGRSGRSGPGGLPDGLGVTAGGGRHDPFEGF